MARLVHGLGRGVELGRGVRDRVGDAGRGHQGALLAVQELRQQLGGGVGGEGLLLRLGQLLEERHPVIDVRAVVDQRLGRIDLRVPGQEFVGIPLVLLGALVEILDLVARHQIVERPGDAHGILVDVVGIHADLPVLPGLAGVSIDGVHGSSPCDCVQYWRAGVLMTKPDRLSSTLIWQLRRLVSRTSKAKSSMARSSSSIGGRRSIHASST